MLGITWENMGVKKNIKKQAESFERSGGKLLGEMPGALY